MDGLRLKLVAKDLLHPMLSDLMLHYAHFAASGQSQGRGKLVGWLIELNNMSASQELTEEQGRQVCRLGQ